MSHELFDDGWVRLEDSVYAISAFWVDPFPLDETTGDRESFLHGYHDGGIGMVQWVNFTHDAAALLKADGGWRSGGLFHLWVSPGAGKLPYEIPFIDRVKLDAGDPDGWASRKQEAIEEAEAVLGLVARP